MNLYTYFLLFRGDKNWSETTKNDATKKGVTKEGVTNEPFC
jgi:hypothetical protein